MNKLTSFNPFSKPPGNIQPTPKINNKPSLKSMNITSLKNKLSNKLTTIQQKISAKTLIISFVSIILLIIVIYVIVSYYNYSKTECYQKNTFFKYLFDFQNGEICIKEKAPIKKPVELPPEQKVRKLLPIQGKEVFHIANQNYTYEQSKCKCESYGARLATKSELIDSYNEGAHWTTYGWTEGQNAYYPIQQCTYDLIKKQNERLHPKDRIRIGLPGLNGGHFPNDQIKFGVNCYGTKPKGSISKLKKKDCPPMNFCKLDSNYDASNKLESDEIIGFNDEKWNM
jgi:hypothetical protein